MGSRLLSFDTGIYHGGFFFSMRVCFNGMGNQVLVAKIRYLLDKNEILSRGLDCKLEGYNHLSGTGSPLDG